MIRRATFAVFVAALLGAAAPAAAGLRVADMGGHLVLGYAKLFADQAPGGSLSMGAGLDHPVGAGFGAGLDVGYHLLGSRTLEQGSLSTALSYSLFEVLAQARWTPSRTRPVTLSGGPGLFVASASLGSSPGGALFSRSAVEETTVGLAFGATLARGGPSPVRVGLEAGVRIVPLESSTWTLATARLAILY